MKAGSSKHNSTRHGTPRHRPKPAGGDAQVAVWAPRRGGAHTRARNPATRSYLPPAPKNARSTDLAPARPAPPSGDLSSGPSPSVPLGRNGDTDRALPAGLQAHTPRGHMHAQDSAGDGRTDERTPVAQPRYITHARSSVHTHNTRTHIARKWSGAHCRAARACSWATWTARTRR